MQRTFSPSQCPKLYSEAEAFCRFSLGKCAPRCNLHFFNIIPSKSVRKSQCLLHFDFQMCFTPRRGALLRSGRQVLLTFEFQICFAPSEATFRLSGATKQVLRDLDLLWIFILLPFLFLTLPTSALQYVHIVGRLASKLPRLLQVFFTKASFC